MSERQKGIQEFCKAEFPLNPYFVEKVFGVDEQEGQEICWKSFPGCV